MKLIIVLAVLMACVLHQARAHGKRSGNAAAAPNANVANILAANENGLVNSAVARPEQLSLAERWALYNLRDTAAANDGGPLDGALDFGRKATDDAVRQREPETGRRAQKRAFAATADVGSYGSASNDDGGADADREMQQQMRNSVRMFRELSPRMRQLLLGQTN